MKGGRGKKVLGAYRYYENGMWGTRSYFIRRSIPRYRRRVIVFGPTGYGKSSILIANAILQNSNVLFISTLPEMDEFRCMPSTVENEVIVCASLDAVRADFVGKLAYCLGNVPVVKKEEIFEREVLPYLESCGIVNRPDVTIILDNLTFLIKSKGHLDKVTRGWKCKVIVDWTCGVFLDECDNPRYLTSMRWMKVPVFEQLWRKDAKNCL